MDQELAHRFEAERRRLVAVAQRLLGSRADAEDAVQETWVRLQRSAVEDRVTNLSGWLTTVTSRVCLDVLRARRARPELLDDEPARAVAAAETGPEAYAEVADGVGAALLVVLDTLAPAERLAFVLHDVFAVPFDEIGPVIDRSPAAARQLASRARRRVQGGAPDGVAPSRSRRRTAVDAFLTASKEGRFADLLAVLDPDAVVRSDAAAAAMGSEAELRGAEAIARAYEGRARAIAPALVDGLPGAVWRHRGEIKVVFVFDVALGEAEGDDRVREVVLVADPERIARADVGHEPGLTVLWWADPDD